MAAATRMIDRVPEVDGKSVEVLILGLSRTGTMSMYTALTSLGYKCYHMYEACVNADKGHLLFWNEALEAKYGPLMQGKCNPASPSVPAPYGSSEFHKLLQDFSALSDARTVLFVPELLEAYPNAHLVLTTHPKGVEGWLRSINNSYFRILKWSVWSWLLMPYDTAFARPYVTILRRVVEAWTSVPWSIARNFGPVTQTQLRTTYTDHIESVRRLAKDQGRRLLEFDPTYGWAPLCEFLGKDIPTKDYPFINQGDHTVNIHKGIVVKRLTATYKPAIPKFLGSLAVVGLAIWWFRRS